MNINSNISKASHILQGRLGSENIILVNREKYDKSEEEIAKSFAYIYSSDNNISVIKMDAAEFKALRVNITSKELSDFLAGEAIVWPKDIGPGFGWDVWNDYVSFLPEKHQATFMGASVAELAASFKNTGQLQNPLTFRARSLGGELHELRFHPVGEFGDKMVLLSNFLTDSKYSKNFYVKPVDVASYGPEDVGRGRLIPMQPGFMLFYDGLPVLIFAAGENQLYYKMGDFDRMIIAVSDGMLSLHERIRRIAGTCFDKVRSKVRGAKASVSEADRRRAAVLRRIKARERKEANGPIGQLGLSLPATTFFLPPGEDPAVFFSGSDEILLVPMRGSKDTAGAYPPRKIIENMRGALGVQVILADYKLRALLRDGKKAREILAEALPKAVANLRESGLERLADLTEFDTVEQVKRWADVKFPNKPSRRVQSHASEIKDILRPAQLLLKALTHAERVVAAFDRAENEPEELATSVMEQALRASSSADLPLEDLCDIARYGDINPVSLWQVNHEQYALVFEALRVMGKIQAGTHAVLPPHLVPIFLALLNPFGRSLDWAQEGESISDLIDDKVRAVARATAELLAPANMAEILAGAAGSGQKLVIERRSRKVSLQPMDGNESETDLGRIYNPLKPRGFMVSIVPRKPEQ